LVREYVPLSEGVFEISQEFAGQLVVVSLVRPRIFWTKGEMWVLEICRVGRLTPVALGSLRN
jgi:hypothetical protein